MEHLKAKRAIQMVLLGKIIGTLGLTSGVVGAWMVATVGFDIVGGFTGSARPYGPEPHSQVVSAAGLENTTRWRFGWGLIVAGFALQAVALCLT